MAVVSTTIRQAKLHFVGFAVAVLVTLLGPPCADRPSDCAGLGGCRSGKDGIILAVADLIEPGLDLPEGLPG
ncbi:hypothetical protein [Prochlorococcus sp. MIT 1201]|uniref:hypothetical protein n=1 Tax=Prochlorococcus sp. MIT 1201 TaxID=3082535 RepID=UPI0039A72F78